MQVRGILRLGQRTGRNGHEKRCGLKGGNDSIAVAPLFPPSTRLRRALILPAPIGWRNSIRLPNHGLDVCFSRCALQGSRNCTRSSRSSCAASSDAWPGLFFSLARRWLIDSEKAPLLFSRIVRCAFFPRGRTLHLHHRKKTHTAMATSDLLSRLFEYYRSKTSMYAEPRMHLANCFPHAGVARVDECFSLLISDVCCSKDCPNDYPFCCRRPLCKSTFLPPTASFHCMLLASGYLFLHYRFGLLFHYAQKDIFVFPRCRRY